MSEPFQPHPRFAVPVLEAEVEQLRKQLAGAQDQIMYLTATINHLQAEHSATVASLQASQTAHDVMTDEEQPAEQDELGGGAG
jgi:septal ring factor EnvC (AmiA/AmiB activator)